MSQSDLDEESDPVRLAWIVVFLLLALGLGAAAVLVVGGELLPGLLSF